MGGRYIQQRYAGDIQGQKFTGMGITGYDNIKKKYVATWIDSMSTGIMNMVGEYDPKEHKLVEMGSASSPMGEQKFKAVTHYVSEDKYTFTMYMQGGEKEQKMMELTYTRVKGAQKKREKKKD